jgi:hypothetical protein
MKLACALMQLDTPVYVVATQAMPFAAGMQANSRIERCVKQAADLLDALLRVRSQRASCRALHAAAAAQSHSRVALLLCGACMGEDRVCNSQVDH